MTIFSYIIDKQTFSVIGYITNENVYEPVNMIFFVHPDPKGSEENQFTPLGAGVNKLIFERKYCHYTWCTKYLYENSGSPSHSRNLIKMMCKKISFSGTGGNQFNPLFLLPPI